jgi:hypothetical protein
MGKDLLCNRRIERESKASCGLHWDGRSKRLAVFREMLQLMVSPAMTVQVVFVQFLGKSVWSVQPSMPVQSDLV